MTNKKNKNEINKTINKIDEVNAEAYNDCGCKIRALRKRGKMSQRVLSYRLRIANSGISRDQIKIIELGKRDIFDIEIIWFAKIFDVSIAYLIGISDDPTEHFDISDTAIDESLRDRANVCGTWVRRAREGMKKMPQEKLAAIMRERGFSFKTHTAISALENGTRRVHLSEIKAFAEIFDLPIMFFFKGTKPTLPNIESYESFVAQDD